MNERFLTWHDHSLNQSNHAAQKQQSPCLIWFTGLSGAGKSTIANGVALALYERNKHSYLLDGDNVRHGLSADLGFSDADRVENIRRIGEVGRLMVDAGLIVLSAFISPFRADRKLVREKFPAGQFFEIYVRAPLSVCEQRDPKGLYKKARRGQLQQFTGIDSAYEEPQAPDLVIDTANCSEQECIALVIEFMSRKGLLEYTVAAQGGAV
ncbi:adenylyl-sulfate kinase [Simiduia sp. 21SJ11W-1]|uniref:adenylyl-sulfate kinase n=1 Tax=Simiduia sp. 21SJ11W-1 TaxID=2909669 RepID=UPI0020A03E19|nr:adenylyl-sulfate kinase [Simiduia sp. 21SJ11W-1]UTA49521.1 adenylyl-sulfate kinase [Simiduia sp. 21SJ11W-1]